MMEPSELRLRIRLYMLRCEAMLYSSRDTSSEGAFTEPRTKKQLQQEISDLIVINETFRQKKGSQLSKDLLKEMFN